MALFMLYSCSKNEIESVSWQPTLLGDGWQVSGAREQGLDSNKINNLYNEANSLDNLYLYYPNKMSQNRPDSPRSERCDMIINCDLKLPTS
jgi:hypothetical protein